MSATHPSARPARSPQATTPRPADGEMVESADGSLLFRLSVVEGRLFVQRTQRGAARPITVQCMVLGDAKDFRQWCDAEPTRFEHPVVFDRLRRYGDEVFARHH
jgi:hypothetical protein